MEPIAIMEWGRYDRIIGGVIFPNPQSDRATPESSARKSHYYPLSERETAMTQPFILAFARMITPTIFCYCHGRARPDLLGGERNCG
jgi:hypothetical protein